MTKPGARLIVEPCRVRDAPRCISTDWAMWYMYHPSKDSKMLWSQLWIEEDCQAENIIHAPFPDYGPGLGFVNSDQTIAPAAKFFLLPPCVPFTTVMSVPCRTLTVNLLFPFRFLVFSVRPRLPSRNKTKEGSLCFRFSQLKQCISAKTNTKIDMIII